LHRAKQGGPPPPDGFDTEYGELVHHGFAVFVARRPVISAEGEKAFLERFRDE